jgi:hypothetical protein
MRQDWIMRIYKQDRRVKSGERLVSNTIWRDRTLDSVQREGRELLHMYPLSKGYRFEIDPAVKTVKNLMTGQAVEIDSDTPHCCDPSSETFWSM